MKELIFCFCLCLMLTNCSNQANVYEKSYNEGVNIVPKPQSLIEKEGVFVLNKNTKIYISSPELTDIALYLQEKIFTSTHYHLTIEKGQGKAKNSILLSMENLKTENKEAYTFDSDVNQVQMRAKTAEGMFYAVQTLLQLLPAEIESPQKINQSDWSIPAVSIEDEPAFVWRGMHVDVCRHFAGIDFIKKHIDVLAMFKINTMHLHLTEDQGWKIEVKQFPELTQKGAIRVDFDGKEYGGFLTQEEIKDIVAYASSRFITIVPEIELPGHAMGALSVYPELGCTGGPYEVRNVWGVERDVFCAGLEETFEFLEKVLDEIIPLFPGKYFHIGGDECPKARWNKCPRCIKRMKEEGLKDADELQSYFIKRIEKVVTRHGKSMVGWDEILEGGLAPTATVMSWRGEQGGIDAANMGHYVVMSPGSHLYLDHYQGDRRAEPVAIGGYTTLEKIYSYNPLPEKLPTEKQKYILGAQVNVWAEYIPTQEIREYRAYPRVIALAELTWTENDKKDYKSFEKRLNNQMVRLDMHKVNYHIPLPEQPNGSCDRVAFVDTAVVKFTTTRPETMVYTLDGSEPNEKSPVYKEAFRFMESATIKIRTLLPSGVMSTVRTVEVEKQDYVKSTKVEKVENGLKGRIAQGRFLSVADLAKISDWKELKAGDFKEINKFAETYEDIEEKHFFAMELEAYLDIPETDVYYISTETDQFWIDGHLLVDNDKQMKKHDIANNSIALAKGLHPIKIVYLSNIVKGYPSIWTGLNVKYRRANEENFTPVSKEMLFR